MFNYFLYSLENERAESSQPHTLSRARCWGGMGPTGTLVLSLPKSIRVCRGSLLVRGSLEPLSPACPLPTPSMPGKRSPGSCFECPKLCLGLGLSLPAI